MTTIRSELQKRAQSELLQYALFRWESAVLIGVTIVLTFGVPKPFLWWPAFGWPLLGLFGLGALVYASLTDAESNAKMLLRNFQEQFNPKTIRDRELRKDVEAALEYQRRIEQQVRGHRAGVMRDRLSDTANQLSDWISNVYQLALRLDAYRQDDLLRGEIESLPKEIEQLDARRKLESNAQTREQLEQVLESKGQHWEALRALNTRMKQAQLQLEQSLTALATIYSQVQLVDAQSVASGKAERLQEDIRAQVNRLDDLVSSINDVYNYNTQGLG